MLASAQTRLRGTISKVNGGCGYGFIVGEDGRDYHFVFANVENKSGPVRRYQVVEFDVMKSTVQGKKDTAFHVRLI